MDRFPAPARFGPEQQAPQLARRAPKQQTRKRRQCSAASWPSLQKTFRAGWSKSEQPCRVKQLGLTSSADDTPDVLLAELGGKMTEDPWTVTTGGRTSDTANLDEKVIEILTATYCRDADRGAGARR